MPQTNGARWRLPIIMAALLLCRARFLVAAVKFGTWRKSLGTPEADREQSRPDKEEAKRQAARIERAAQLLPFHIKCLPRAMALSWVLRDRMIRHSVVFAVRPAQFRGSLDDLHAWVEVEGEKVLGDLPGTWAELHRIGE